MSLETEPISSRLEKALSLRNMKQQELADRTKIPKSSISQYLSGYAEPKSDRAYIMAQVLDVSPVWLLGFDVPMENQPNEKTGELLVEIRKSPRLLHLVEYFMKLNPSQQESVLALIRSMTDTRQER